MHSKELSSKHKAPEDDEEPEFLVKIANAYRRGGIELEDVDRIMHLLQRASEKGKIDTTKEWDCLSNKQSETALD